MFSGGEVSPRLHSRSDMDKYFQSLDTLENFLVTLHGPTDRRPGTRFVAETKLSAQRSRLVPFQFSSVQAYMLEFGDLYIRFYRDGGQIQQLGVPYEVATLYDADDVLALQFVQSADVLFIVHPNHPPRKLTRFADDDWTLEDISFDPPATVHVGFVPAVDVTPTTTTGNGVNFTTSANFWLAGDVGREIVNEEGSGIALITSVTTPTVAVANISEPFPGGGTPETILAGDWLLTGSPNAGLTPSALAPQGALVTLTLDAAGWRSGEVGKFVFVNGGIVEITVFTSATVVSGIILRNLSTLTQAKGGEWTLENEAWTTLRGFPRAITLHEGRLILAGTAAQPNTVWGSSTESFTNFGLGPEDDHAWSFDIASPLVDFVEWVAPVKRLFVGTVGSELTVNDGQTDPISPSNVQIRSESDEGSISHQPIRVKNTLVFVNKHASKLAELGFSWEHESFLTIDLLLLAEHLAGPCVGRIAKIAYQKDPGSIIWAVRDDGQMLAITHLKDQNVTGAAREIFGGTFNTGEEILDAQAEDVAVIPHWTEPIDSVWFIVKRTINGVTKRYIEHLDLTLNTDCALTRGPDEFEVDTVSGLDHLEGETVQIVVDGEFVGTDVVVGGALVLAEAGNEIEVGLPYVSTLVTLPIQVPGASTLTGLIKRVSKVVVRFFESITATINGQARVLGTSPVPFSGDTIVENLGYDNHGRITIVQTDPYPLTIREIAAEVNMDDDRR